MAREFAADAAAPPSWVWWLFVAALAVVLIAMPNFTDVSLQLDLSIIFVLALLALSMSFLWGYVGILSFGQTIFFGLGGYSYAILALNAGTTLWPFAVAICLPMIFAAVLGYFVIYGRINDIYLSVITLVVTLIFGKEHPLHLRPGICHRQRAAEWTERHSRRARPATFLGRLGALHRRRFLSGGRRRAARLCRLTPAAPHIVRPHHRRHPRERNADGAPGL